MSTNGFLFLGEAAMATSPPGRRIDSGYMEAVSNKISFALQYAKENNLTPVFLGGLAKKKFEVRVLATWLTLLEGIRPLYLVSPSDIKNGEIDPHCLAGILSAAGKIDLIGLKGRAIPFDFMDGSKVYLYPVVEGEKPPNSLGFDEGLPIGHKTLLVGSMPVVGEAEGGDLVASPVAGAECVINSWPEKSDIRRTGDCVHVNTGPVTRLSSHHENEVPTAFAWTHEVITPIELPHEEHVFEHTLESISHTKSKEGDFVQMFADKTKERLDGDVPISDVLDSVRKESSSSSEVWSTVDDLLKAASTKEAVGF